MNYGRSLNSHMRRILVISSAFLFLFSFSTSFSSADHLIGEKKICPAFVFVGNLSPDLSEVEKRLICGDPEQQVEPPNEGWRTIPYPQAKFNLTNFLQERGYFHPVFKPDYPHPGVSTVEIGYQTVVSRVILSGDYGEVRFERKRDILGQTLTPGLLNALEKWVSE